MAKRKKLSGFPEWLPEEKLIEQYFIDKIRQKFELYGFSPLEPRSVEPLDVLLSKGDDKEIYLLNRLHSEKQAEFGLHFDMTVPFARFVEQNRGQLIFPFKRYQIQKAWRGERPQEGRYREFYQADIDVVAENSLDISYDAELPRIILELFAELPVPTFSLKINNRKILSGFYQALGITDTTATLRILDKLDKIGKDAVLKLLIEELAIEPNIAQECLNLAMIKTPDSSFYKKVKDFGYDNELLNQGLDELKFVMDSLSDVKADVYADLSIARGLDYYTGTVFESELAGYERLGSVCSGGRYENLVGDDKLKLPGIGISIGLTRILGPLFKEKRLSANRKTPIAVLVALVSNETKAQANKTANSLRSRNIPTEVYHKAQNYGKQIRAAERKGIAYICFYDPKDANKHEIKDIRTGEQFPIDINTWLLPEADSKITVSLLK